jgi:hypothetical protein
MRRYGFGVLCRCRRWQKYVAFTLRYRSLITGKMRKSYVGDDDGTDVGFVGCDDGCDDGNDDGWLVGTRVGRRVGRGVGPVGLDVGCPEGLVGIDVGMLLGCRDG